MSNNTITSITLPEGLTSIEDEAFSGCNLTSITITESVTSIGKSAFSYCSSLISVAITSRRVTSIGYGAFNGCSLISVVCKSSSPPNIENIGWIVEKINVSASSVDLYKTAEGWKDYNIEAITSIN